MGSQKIIYRIQSTNQLVIKSGLDVCLTSKEVTVNPIYEILDDNGELTGNRMSIHPENLERFR